MTKLKCANCGSENVRVHIDESLAEDSMDVSIEATVECLDCKQTYPLPDELDWRDY
jgi:hypothetical protein